MNELEVGASAMAASGGASSVKSAAGYAGFKAVGILGGAITLVSTIVMVMTNPVTKREMFVALLSTFAFSLFGGSFAIEYLGLQSWLMDGTLGLLGIGGVFICCGAPGWMIVRAFFKWQESNKELDIVQLWSKIKSIFGK